MPVQKYQIYRWGIRSVRNYGDLSGSRVSAVCWPQCYVLSVVLCDIRFYPLLLHSSRGLAKTITGYSPVFTSVRGFTCIAHCYSVFFVCVCACTVEYFVGKRSCCYTACDKHHLEVGTIIICATMLLTLRDVHNKRFENY